MKQPCIPRRVLPSVTLDSTRLRCALPILLLHQLNEVCVLRCVLYSLAAPVLVGLAARGGENLVLEVSDDGGGVRRGW